MSCFTSARSVISYFLQSLLLLSLLMLTACGSVVKKNAPTIAHIHIGHAITAWPKTRNNQGLLVEAEIASVRAATNSELLVRSAREGSIGDAKKYLKAIAMSVDPGYFDQSKEEDYGLRRATAEAITHLKLASEVPDASANVQRTVARTNINAQEIIDRADELVAFLEEGLKSENIEEIEIIAEEINHNVSAIAGGPEKQSLYGLYELRQDIENMVAREDPPYETVDSWHLFNLVKLPSGEWGFSSRSSRGAAGAGY